MRGFASVLALVGVIALGYWAYHQTILTQHSERRVDQLQRDIGAERERLAILRAEWAYLNRPDRLRELAEKHGVPAYLVDGAEDVRDEWLQGVQVVGVTAGASAPESLVQGVIERLRASGGKTVEELSGRAENIEFALPKGLRVTVSDA